MSARGNSVLEARASRLEGSDYFLLRLHFAEPGLRASSANPVQMTRLPAKVLSSEKRPDQYCVTVEIELSDFRRSFNSLRFGDQIPFNGSFRDGNLELRYYRGPGLKVGQ